MKHRDLIEKLRESRKEAVALLTVGFLVAGEMRSAAKAKEQTGDALRDLTVTKED